MQSDSGKEQPIENRLECLEHRYFNCKDTADMRNQKKKRGEDAASLEIRFAVLLMSGCGKRRRDSMIHRLTPFWNTVSYYSTSSMTSLASSFSITKCSCPLIGDGRFAGLMVKSHANEDALSYESKIRNISGKATRFPCLILAK